MEALGFRKARFRHNNGYTGVQFSSQMNLHLCYAPILLDIKHSILKKDLTFFSSILWTSFEQKHYLQIPKLAHPYLSLKDTCTHCIYSYNNFLCLTEVNKSSTSQLYMYRLLQFMLLNVFKISFSASL